MRRDVYTGMVGLFISLVFFTVCCPPESTAETIRVALSRQAARVTILSPRHVRLYLPSNGSTIRSTPLRIERNAHGLRINSQRMKSNKVLVDGRKQTIRVKIEQGSTGKGHATRVRDWNVGGAVLVQSVGPQLSAVNRVDLEEYVAEVVNGEINPHWPGESLKAQAVAARTYVLYKKMLRKKEPYDVAAGVQDQVYEGKAHVNPTVQQAVHDTRGRVITYQRRPIFAAYSSTAAGPTEDARFVWDLDLPYLKGVECPFDAGSPRYAWQVSIPLQELERHLRRSGYHVGTIATITPYTFTPSGRVDRLRILHSLGALILRGQDFRRAVGYSRIFSTHFHIERLDKNLVLEGNGSGHGVGLCQWGMKEMAELGYDYQTILRYYYPGTKLLPLRKVKLAPQVSS